ncbi:glycine-rich protein, partial [Brevibacillus sp. SKDU10]|uniref:glycine-rich protein n=1 Tax=Brevibacillus sp. SKDU10 TaxID=1247872 RepID=UPI001E4273F1
MATYGGSVYLGTLRNKTTVIPRPIRPWQYGEPYKGAGNGNIADFRTDSVISNWNIGDSDANLDNQLHWHKIIDGSKTLLICDRVILTAITWDDLNSDNRIFGKTITIDGRQFKLRVLTVGSNYRGHPREGGLPKDNEWDRFITNEDAISGIPSPVESDIDDLPLGSTDRYSPHNIFWNWMAIYSWGQEDASVGGKACRGERSARFWSNGFSYSRDDWRGWRPVLEVLNQAPTLALTSPSDNQPLTENQRINIGTNDFTVSITANDADPDDTLQYQVKLNNVVKQAWTTIAKNQPVSYTFKNADITAGSTPFTVSVRDDKGNQTDFNGELTKGKIGKDTQGRTTYTFEYTGKPEMFTVPPNTTKLQLECWGAQGGGAGGGLGGYSRGAVAVTAGMLLNIYVGSKPTGVYGGYNGGGDGGANSLNGQAGRGGGGATDIRQGGTTLLDRIIVAGGGGGGLSGGRRGGAGGGVVGGDAYGGEIYNDAKGGTQTEGGASGKNGGEGKPPAGLGQGGTGNYGTSTSYPIDGGSGGGGGYYGG